MLSRDASAAEPSAEDRAQALRLFAQGTQLLTDGSAREACPKLEEAEHLAPGYGIELNLGDCYEKTKRLASAWAMYQKAASTANANGQRDRENNASSRARALESRVSYLTIEVAPASRITGLVVSRDGRELGPGQWAEPLPVDAGPHVVSATAPDHQSWQTDVRVDEGARLVARVPVLGAADRAIVPPPPTGGGNPSPGPLPPPDSPPTWPRTAGLVSLGLGAGGLATGAVLVLLAKGKHDDADPHCPAANHCDSDGVSLRGSAVDLANGATVAFVIGAVGLVAGGGLLWFGPSPSAAPRAGLTIGPAQSSAGLEARYVF